MGPLQSSGFCRKIRVCPRESKWRENGPKCPDLLANEVFYQLNYGPRLGGDGNSADDQEKHRREGGGGFGGATVDAPPLYHGQDPDQIQPAAIGKNSGTNTEKPLRLAESFGNIIIGLGRVGNPAQCIVPSDRSAAARGVPRYCTTAKTFPTNRQSTEGPNAHGKTAQCQ